MLPKGIAVFLRLLLAGVAADRPFTRERVVGVIRSRKPVAAPRDSEHVQSASVLAPEPSVDYLTQEKIKGPISIDLLRLKFDLLKLKHDSLNEHSSEGRDHSASAQANPAALAKALRARILLAIADLKGLLMVPERRNFIDLIDLDELLIWCYGVHDIVVDEAGLAQEDKKFLTEQLALQEIQLLKDQIKTLHTIYGDLATRQGYADFVVVSQHVLDLFLQFEEKSEKEVLPGKSTIMEQLSLLEFKLEVFVLIVRASTLLISSDKGSADYADLQSVSKRVLDGCLELELRLELVDELTEEEEESEIIPELQALWEELRPVVSCGGEPAKRRGMSEDEPTAMLLKLAALRGGITAMLRTEASLTLADSKVSKDLWNSFHSLIPEVNELVVREPKREMLSAQLEWLRCLLSDIAPDDKPRET